MKTFAELYDRAVERKGEAELAGRLPSCKTPEELIETPDDRILAAMTQTVFSAGFVWRVIQNKWPGFEEAFGGFHPATVAGFGAEEIGQLMQDTRIVRNGQKINAAIDNAEYVLETSNEHGGFGRFLAEWPLDDTVGLWSHLHKNGKRLGGDSGPRVLRRLGRDTFILTGDVTRSMIDQGIVTKKPTSKRDLAAAQEAFSAWSAESGRPFCEISVVIANTVESSPH